MKQTRLLGIVALFLSIPPLFAQHKVDARNIHERLICVVPMVGRGTPDDPRRPMFAPAPGQKPSYDGLLAFSYDISDDGKSALVEFVFRDRAGMASILSEKSKRSDITVFEKGKNSREEIEKEFKKYKRDFDIDRFGARAR